MSLFMITVTGIEIHVLYFLFWLRKKLWEKKNGREGVGHGGMPFLRLFILVEFNYIKKKIGAFGVEEGRFAIFKIIILLEKKKKKFWVTTLNTCFCPLPLPCWFFFFFLLCADSFSFLLIGV